MEGKEATELHLLYSVHGYVQWTDGSEPWELAIQFTTAEPRSVIGQSKSLTAFAAIFEYKLECRIPISVSTHTALPQTTYVSTPPNNINVKR